MTPLLHIRGLTKRYDDLVAVDDVSLDIEPGEIFALLGPNGAGKTTLIGCVTGLTVGFEGTIEVAGFDVVRDYRVTRRIIGLVPQELNYDAFFSVRNTLAFQAGYFGIRADDDAVMAMLRQFDLADKREAKSRWLSGGMKRRLMICKALMHRPALLFLDEPTAGVDVELRDELWEYVRRLRDGGTTIVLTTHYLEEAEQLADRIGIIHHGRLMRVDRRDDLMREYGVHRASIEVKEPLDAGLVAKFGDDVVASGTQIELTYRDVDSGPSPLDELLRALFQAGHEIERLEARSSSLEEIFRDLVYGRTEDER